MSSNTETNLQSRISTARNALLNALDKVMPEKRPKPSIGLILGSGLGSVVDNMQANAKIAYGDIEGLVESTAPGHNGSFLFTEWHDSSMMVCQGRVHLYEGYSAQDVAMPIYLMAAMGVKTLIISNAAGGLNHAYEPGEVVIIRDHINMTGKNPLIGVDAPEIGVRFPDMSRAYDPDLIKVAHKLAEEKIKQGIYVGVTGPSLETSAERRFFHQCGGDMVGMSTVMETIAANHCGMAVLGLSVITNKATGGQDQKPDTLEDVLANAKIGGAKISSLLQKLIPTLER